MANVFEFLDEFSGLLRGESIRFAITSGMACVRYGIQQTTKDSDWIVEPEHLERLCSILASLEARMPPMHVVYRPIFGAPLDASWHRGGWTSHIAISTGPQQIAQHLDFFGRPPRVAKWQPDPERPDFADRDTVARMKKTDRDRDWPVVSGLASQALARGHAHCLQHLQSAEMLRRAWHQTEEPVRHEAARSRPLLEMIESEPDDLRLESAIRAERLVWESVNRERYRLYQREWKEFYRRWQTDSDWHWPTCEPFMEQHKRLVGAARKHQLPQDPLESGGMREKLYRRGLARASVLSHYEEESLRRMAPPVSEMLP